MDTDTRGEGMSGEWGDNGVIRTHMYYKKYCLGSGSISVLSLWKCIEQHTYDMGILYVLHFNKFNFIAKVLLQM